MARRKWTEEDYAGFYKRLAEHYKEEYRALAEAKKIGAVDPILTIIAAMRELMTHYPGAYSACVSVFQFREDRNYVPHLSIPLPVDFGKA